MTLPDTMRALILKQDGYAADLATDMATDLAPFVQLADMPLPDCGPGQVLIKVARAAVNPSDMMFVQGLYGQPRVKGQPAGFEGTGTVVAGDTPFLGQRVSFVSSGSGSWAEYALAEAARLIPLHPDLSDDDAAGLVVNPMTAMAMFDVVRDEGAPSFVITAAGSQLGKFLIALGKDHDLPAIAVVRRAEQAEALRSMGAADVLVSSAADYVDLRDASMARHGPRILLDAVADQIAADLFFAMPRGARWIAYGRLATDPPQLTQMGQFIFMDKRIEGFWLSQWMRKTDIGKVGQVIQNVQSRFVDGLWHTDVTATLSLDDALAGLSAQYGKGAGKLLIAP